MKYLTPFTKAFYDKISNSHSIYEMEERLIEFASDGLNLQNIWVFRNFIRKIEEEKGLTSPVLIACRAYIYAYEGNLLKARECIESLEENSIYREFSEVSMPYLTDEEFIEKVHSLKEKNVHGIGKLSITIGKPSVVNGFRDLTSIFTDLEHQKEEFTDMVNVLYEKPQAEIIYKLALAERFYQTNRLYEALMLVCEVRPVLMHDDDANLLFVALVLEIEILLMSGQIQSTAMKMEEIRRFMKEKSCEEYLPNLAAISAQAAMYDGENARIKSWLENEAPDDNDEFSLLYTFQYMVKMRVYLIEGKHIALLSLAGRLLPLLSQGHRSRDLCEVHMLLALSAFSRDYTDTSFKNLSEALALAEKYGYDRLFADEGDKMYALLKEYQKTGEHLPYVKHLLSMTSVVAESYSKYLKAPFEGATKKLTKKELEVLEMLDTKLTYREIGKQLYVAEATVKYHVKNICITLGCKKRKEAVLKAKEMGIIK